MKNRKENITGRNAGSFSFLRFAITGLWLLLISGVFIVAKIFLVYV
ncbi:MAG: hypothetical protein JXR36_00295 [Bacteroidales bacterium]|nr:hypothetical protein [Bacteroidales bacterium]